MDTQANGKMKTVYTIVERGEKGSSRSFWVRVGVGFVNQDGSINLRLDATPVNGTLQIRDWEAKDDAPARRSSSHATMAAE